MDAWIHVCGSICNRMEFILMNETVIHTVTLLDIQDYNPVISRNNTITEGNTIVENSGRRVAATRCVGFEVAYEDAERAVLSNNGDMHEFRWNYIVIEKIDRGMWRIGKPVAWFAWVNDKWEPTACPNFLESVRSFAIG